MHKLVLDPQGKTKAKGKYGQARGVGLGMGRPKLHLTEEVQRSIGFAFGKQEVIPDKLLHSTHRLSWSLIYGA
jgi:hypothetical protein